MKNARYLQLQEQNLRNLILTGAFQFVNEHAPWFPYTSGQIGAYYIQSIAIEKDGPAYATAIQSLVELIGDMAEPCDVISGGESRDWDFSNPVAVALGKPHLKLYKDGRALGAEVAGKRVLHVADLNNEGSSLRDHWKPAIEKRGGRLLGLLSFVDRQEDGLQVLQQLGLPAWSVVPLDKAAWDFMLREKHIAPQLHQTLQERMQDKEAWALKALQRYPDYFRQFYHDQKNRAKAEKIMLTYPTIRPALEAMLK